jgi:hypothetical protein
MTTTINGKGARRKALEICISDYTNLQKLDFYKNYFLLTYNQQPTEDDFIKKRS